MGETETIKQQADLIRASGALGRSKSYARLFDYLVRNSLEGRTVKELEIASEVFGKSADFDPAQDSMVRVYAHNLRQKLRKFYAGPGRDETHILAIPRGEYRLIVKTPGQSAPTTAHPPPRYWRIAAMGVAALIIGVLIGASLGSRTAASDYRDVAESPLWQAVMDDDLPVLVVVGDYYIFAELDSTGNVMRFVREFSINSAEDLDVYTSRRPEQADRYQDLNVTYLARSAARSLGDVLRVLYAKRKSVDVVTMSELSPAAFRTHHVVYVGYFSALDKLFDFTLASSTLAIGETFDELWNLETGDVYTSEAGRPDDYRNYRDYGYFSTFPGPSGNQFVVIAGTRDEGVMHVAQITTNPNQLAATVAAIPDGSAGTVMEFELLYEVSGFDRTNVDARLVHSAPLDFERIWPKDATASGG